MDEQSDYLKYRGKCKEMSEALVANNPALRLVRGHYWCPIWNTMVTREPNNLGLAEELLNKYENGK